MIETAKLLQNILMDAGFRTYAAGGFVRDYLLGREAKDIDLATEALPEEVRDVLLKNNIRVEDTGLKHGTVSAIIDKIPYEITTLRIDKNCFGREADVSFVKSFEEDSKRRDFTINAMFMDLNTEEVIDYHHGQDDLAKGVLRFVGYPHDRIKEDYLRILRLFRFGSQLGFSIEPEAGRVALAHVPHMMSYVSTERIYTEMTKLLMGEGAYFILNKYRPLLFQVFPELELTVDLGVGFLKKKKDVFTDTLFAVDYMRQFKDIGCTYSALFANLAKPFTVRETWDGGDTHHKYPDYEEESSRIAQKICHRLKFSTEDTRKIQFLILNQNRLLDVTSNLAVRRVIQDCTLAGDKLWIWDILKLREADLQRQGNPDPRIQKLLKSLILEELVYFTNGKLDSPLSGKELMEGLSLTPGPNLGIVKNYLQELVVNGDLEPQDTENAWKFAKNYISENSLV